MGRQASAIHVRRVAVVLEARASDNSPNYKDMFEVLIPDGDRRTAEQWVRAIFEDAPRPVRWFLLLGWRVVLGLRLGPLTSPDHILGWPIVSREPDAIRLELHSALMKSQLALHLSGTTAIWSTDVYYTRPMARLLWVAVGVIHRQMVPRLLRRAASRPRPTTLSNIG
jgi:hypothetical protein